MDPAVLSISVEVPNSLTGIDRTLPLPLRPCLTVQEWDAFCDQIEDVMSEARRAAFRLPLFCCSLGLLVPLFPGFLAGPVLAFCLMKANESRFDDNMRELCMQQHFNDVTVHYNTRSTKNIRGEQDLTVTTRRWLEFYYTSPVTHRYTYVPPAV